MNQSFQRERIEFLSQDLLSIKVDLTCYVVEAVTKRATRNTTVRFEFGGHLLSDRICEFVMLKGPSSPSGTLANYCHALASFLEYSQISAYQTLNSESFAGYLEWMKTNKSARTLNSRCEGTRRVYGSFVIQFMEWLVDVGDIRPNQAFAARLRQQQAFRGINARALERMRLYAISPEDYVCLIRAIRMEYEQCKDVLEQPKDVQNRYDITFPLLPFSMLLGAKLAVRAVEFNNLRVGDLRGDRLLLNPPNKKPSEIGLPLSVMAALELAQKWMARYRTNPGPNDPLLVCPVQHGPRYPGIVQFDTSLLGNSVRRFYRKYFTLSGADGVSVLYKIAEDDECRLLPFSLSFANFRSAAITEAARHERNPTVIRRFARHESFDTTFKYYIRQVHREWVSNVARHLAPSAELLRISLETRVASPTEEEMAKEAAAHVPGGHCEQALAGDRSCRRASDCRLCVFFRIHISKREFFVKDREEALQQAEGLQTEQGLTRDAENLREFAALNQSIISRIDEHLAGQEAIPLDGCN